MFHKEPEALGIRTVYDVAHNTARFERFPTSRGERRLLVHRKGATRALPPGHPDLPPAYRVTGQPVIIGGSMETGSYLLAGLPSSAAAFYSTAHGSGRTMSRHKARKLARASEVEQRMAKRGIVLRAASRRVVAEESGPAYKDVDAVALAAEVAGLSKRVAHLRPIGNVKG
jgi:tRNA-splicing ligase RtcB